MVDDLFVDYITRFLDVEVTPLLPEPEGIDLAAYKRTLLLRFANPAIADGLDRLCRRASTKMAHHVLPSLRQALAEDRPFAMLALAVAAWFRHLGGRADDGRTLVIDDPQAPRLQQLARRGGTDPRPLLGERSLFGDLGDDPRLVAVLEDLLTRMARDGVRATLADELTTARLHPATPGRPG
jgi:fructuronate reductase/mannitol 2-dehydrogenase